MNSYKYLAVDSTTMDILYHLHYLRQKYGKNITINKISANYDQIKRDFNFYQMLYEQIFITKKIRIVALETVCRDFEGFPLIVDFMEKYCYSPNFNSEAYKNRYKNITELANAYFNDYTINGKVNKAPLDISTMTESQQYAAAKYATLMAQATDAGVHLLTTYTGLIYDKSTQPYTRRAKRAIFDINKAHGYYYELPLGQVITSEPYLIGDIGIIINTNQRFFTPELSKGISKCELSL